MQRHSTTGIATTSRTSASRASTSQTNASRNVTSIATSLRAAIDVTRGEASGDVTPRS